MVRPIESTSAVTTADRVKSGEGRKGYALRNQTVEPVFGIIKSVMGFRQFSLRGLDQVLGERRIQSRRHFTCSY